MNFHGKDIKIFTGSSNVDVAQGIAGCLGLPLGKSDCTQFSDCLLYTSDAADE